MATTKDSMVVQYLEAVEREIAKYPKLEWTRETSKQWAASAKLGRARRRIRTKGGLTDIPAGSLVLFAPDQYGIEEPGDALSIWVPRNDGSALKTLVGPEVVDAVCETCYGSGAVRHPAGLVTFSCPSC